MLFRSKVDIIEPTTADGGQNAPHAAGQRLLCEIPQVDDLFPQLDAEAGTDLAPAPLDQASAVAALLARCFPPFHDREGMASTLEQLDSITRGVRVDRLRFVPTPEIVECVRGWTRP